MRLQRCLTIPVSAACVIAATLLIASGQQPGNSRMQIKPTGRSELPIEPYNATKHHVFEPVFTNPLWAPMRPYAIVLHNSTNRRVMGLDVRWTYIDRDGRQRRLDVRTDNFTTGRMGMGPGTDLLIVPGTSMPADLAGKPSFGAAPSMDMVDKLLFSPESSVELDTVILEDGEVIGPDQSGLVHSIRQKDAALRFLNVTVAEARASGKDPRAALAEVRAKYPPKRSDTEREQWIRSLTEPLDPHAAEIMKVSDDEVLRRHLERHPLPNFYRKPN